MKTFSLTSLAWQFKQAGTARWRTAQVPGCVHTDLLRHGAIEDPFWSTNELKLQWIENAEWLYRADFDLESPPLPEEYLELVADGLDTVATVTVNGVVVGSTENMFVAHRWDVSSLLKSRRNRIEVRFHSTRNYLRRNRPHLEQGELNDPEGRAPAIRKQQCQFGWDWGPRLVTSGIWKDLRIEVSSGTRLVSVRVLQSHHKDGNVLLRFKPELSAPDSTAVVSGWVERNGALVAKIENGLVLLEEPELWWPNGYGEQPLYDVKVSVSTATGKLLGTWRRRIGLRTIELVRKPDRAGESFYFQINGVFLFAKGANWIPAHTFVASLDRSHYEPLLASAARANMNMIRVWGGGIYEHESFYDLCDELGLLVWQDFMFACALYPADQRFLASVREEAVQQVQRLRHRTCLALWCGNNESEHLNHGRLKKKKLKQAYDAVFEDVLPKAVQEHDGVTTYWPSSPHRPDDQVSNEAGEKHGDTHFWEVWHARKPVKEYEKWRFRFCSEFGMQSFSSPETNANFCPPDDRNLFGPSMENHQKNRGGSQVILDYVFRRYRLPKTQADLIYLSQLNQAYCMQVGVEHFRRLMPHCAGALYWQLNDCWPAASWSSLEFGGRWRALHFAAKRFFAPALVSAHLCGDETYGVGNYRKNEIKFVELFTVYDGRVSKEALLRWDVFALDGECLFSGSKAVPLRHGQSRLQKRFPISTLLQRRTRDQVILRIALDCGGERLSEESVFLAPPRFLDLPRAPIHYVLKKVSENRFSLTLQAPVFQHRVHLNVKECDFQASDNFFDLFPNEAKSVEVSFKTAPALKTLRSALTLQSLADLCATS